MIGMLMTDE
jgi:hypothetical protein